MNCNKKSYAVGKGKLMACAKAHIRIAWEHLGLLGGVHKSLKRLLLGREEGPLVRGFASLNAADSKCLLSTRAKYAKFDAWLRRAVKSEFQTGEVLRRVFCPDLSPVRLRFQHY